MYHIVTLSHTHGQRVASLRRPEVAGTAEASRFNFVPHQILSAHMIMPLWVGVHDVLQGKRCHSVILLFLFQYICHSVHLQLICPQCPPCPACMHTLLRLQEAIVLCEQNFSLLSLYFSAAVMTGSLDGSPRRFVMLELILFFNSLPMDEMDQA